MVAWSAYSCSSNTTRDEEYRDQFSVRCWLALLVLSLSACAPIPERQAAYKIVADAHSGGSALAISGDSAYGASGGRGGKLRIWRLTTGKPLAHWPAHRGSITGLTFLVDRQRLLSTGWDGLVKVWDINGNPIREWDLGAPISSFQASADRELVLLGLSDGRVELRNARGESFGSWRPSKARISAVALNSTASRLAAADARAGIWRWSPRTSPAPLTSPASSMRTLTFDPRDGTLWGGGWFDLYHWSNHDSRLRRLSTAHRGIINHIEFGPKTRYLATISRHTDSAVLLLDPDTGESRRAFKKHALCGARLAISPDGRRMMSNSDDASVRFYDLTTD